MLIDIEDVVWVRAALGNEGLSVGCSYEPQISAELN